MKLLIKVLCFMCCNLLLLLFVGCGKDYNESSVEVLTTENAEILEIDQTTLEATTTSAVAQNSITATNIGLYNAQTMECLYSKATANRIYPASLTKILTACTALKYVSPDTVFTVGTEQSLVPKGSSLCLIQPGHRL